MRKPLLAGAAAAAAFTLFTVSPASAATEPDTVTIHSVPADTAVTIPDDYDVWGDANRFVMPGAVEFPLEAEPYDGDLIHETFAMSARAPEGCVRAIESFTFGYTLADYDPASTDSVFVRGGVGTGEPLDIAPLVLGDIVDSGDGIDLVLAGDDEDRAEVQLGLRAVPVAQSGILTISFPAPVGPVDARGYVAFDMPLSTTWVVDHASFLVTDTCASGAEASAVLPATGVEAGLTGTAAAVLLGSGAVGLLLTRRRMTS